MLANFMITSMSVTKKCTNTSKDYYAQVANLLHNLICLLALDVIIVAGNAIHNTGVIQIWKEQQN